MLSECVPSLIGFVPVLYHRTSLLQGRREISSKSKENNLFASFSTPNSSLLWLCNSRLSKSPLCSLPGSCSLWHPDQNRQETHSLVPGQFEQAGLCQLLPCGGLEEPTVPQN